MNGKGDYHSGITYMKWKQEGIDFLWAFSAGSDVMDSCSGGKYAAFIEENKLSQT